MLVCFCLFLCGSKREREGWVPFFAIVEWYTLTCGYGIGLTLGLHFRLQITSRECNILVKAGIFIYYVGVIFSC